MPRRGASPSACSSWRLPGAEALLVVIAGGRTARSRARRSARARARELVGESTRQSALENVRERRVVPAELGRRRVEALQRLRAFGFEIAHEVSDVVELVGRAHCRRRHVVCVVEVLRGRPACARLQSSAPRFVLPGSESVVLSTIAATVGAEPVADLLERHVAILDAHRGAAPRSPRPRSLRRRGQGGDARSGGRCTAPGPSPLRACSRCSSAAHATAVGETMGQSGAFGCEVGHHVPDRSEALGHDVPAPGHTGSWQLARSPSSITERGRDYTVDASSPMSGVLAARRSTTSAVAVGGGEGERSRVARRRRGRRPAGRRAEVVRPQRPVAARPDDHARAPSPTRSGAGSVTDDDHTDPASRRRSGAASTTRDTRSITSPAPRAGNEEAPDRRAARLDEFRPTASSRSRSTASGCASGTTIPSGYWRRRTQHGPAGARPALALPPSPIRSQLHASSRSATRRPPAVPGYAAHRRSRPTSHRGRSAPGRRARRREPRVSTA